MWTFQCKRRLLVFILAPASHTSFLLLSVVIWPEPPLGLILVHLSRSYWMSLTGKLFLLGGRYSWMRWEKSTMFSKTSINHHSPIDCMQLYMYMLMQTHTGVFATRDHTTPVWGSCVQPWHTNHPLGPPTRNEGAKTAQGDQGVFGAAKGAVGSVWKDVVVLCPHNLVLLFTGQHACTCVYRLCSQNSKRRGNCCLVKTPP